MMRKKQQIWRSVNLIYLTALLFLPACSHSSKREWVYHRVKVNRGDTINSLASHYKTHRMNIVRANPQLLTHSLKVGQWLRVPIYQRTGSDKELIYGNHRSMNGDQSDKRGLIFGTSSQRSSVRLRFPVSGKITSPFGMRDGRAHHGIDIRAAQGTGVAAAAAGKVIFSGWQNGYGKTVILSHDSGRYKTLYAHLSEIGVKSGQWMTSGSRLGSTGTTGRSSGPHLHFELRDRRDIPVNPINYLPKSPNAHKSLLFGAR